MGRSARRIVLIAEAPSMANQFSEMLVTASNIEDIRTIIDAVAHDQAEQLAIGCRVWAFENAEGFTGYITVWPDGAKAALASRAFSHWGKWSEGRRQLTLDNGDVYNERGGVGEDA